MSETNLTPIKKNVFSNLKEWIRSKIDKKYILNSNSPQSLFKNEKLVIRTLKQNPFFLESLPDEIIFKNDTFIKLAIESGYFIDFNSRFCSSINFISKFMDISGKLPNIEMLDESIFSDEIFREKFLIQARKERLLINEGMPQFLRNDRDLALIYYENFFEKNKNKVNISLKYDYILNSNLILDVSFLSDFINLCVANNVSNQELLNAIMNIPNSNTILKNNPQIINLIFNKLQPENLRDFFSTLKFSDKDLESFFKNSFTGNLEELRKICEKNPIAIDSLSGKLLGRDIPLFKLQQYSGDKEFQEKLLGLSPFQYILFEKISSRNLSKSDRWHRLDSYTLDNIGDGYYDELLNDVFNESKKGNKITKEELDVLANLFSSHVFGPKALQSMGLEPRTNNVFNITSKSELKFYEKIRQSVCDRVIATPELESTENVKQFDKYLQYFKTLEPIDRVKLAIIEKCFGMSLEDASVIMRNFGSGILTCDSIDVSNQDIIEQIIAICSILDCQDIETLQEVGQAVDFISLDLNQATLLFDDATKVFENDLKKDLYSPKEEDLVGTYEGVKVYRAPLEFGAITKFIGKNPDKSLWESSYSNFDGKKNFRRKSSMSYTNGELLDPRFDGTITLGFGKVINDFQFGGMYTNDAHSNMATDPIYGAGEEISSCKSRNDFVSETTGKFNEVVVDTLATDDSLDGNKKLMPEYIIYYQKSSDMSEEDRKDDINWQNALKAAKEFDVSIVIVDCEAVRKNELKKIKEGIEQNKHDYNSVKKLVSQIRHYLDRYETNENSEISELISKEELEEKEKFLREHKPRFNLGKYLQTRLKQKDKKLEGEEIDER